MRINRFWRQGLARTAFTLFAALAVLPVSAATGSAASAAAADFVECSQGSLSVRVDTATRAVTGTGSVSRCVAQVNFQLTSATITVSGTATQLAGLLVSTVTTETIRWNTGETTTLTVQRSYFGASGVSAVGVGKATGGVLYPADEFDNGNGTRRNNVGSVSLTNAVQLIMAAA
ncbi:MAG TPA: hypothetical protein VFV67_11150 [Actinophytocola sp.]|uniref:hypothetical protein n=1 Tax=Actinophytocola sp. TaxID=1872138 RepID=UPI002DBC2F8A|nr:hypothetical protein [Actinophytocola sp.]HEU5471200.1 hypothetical protein [Actinophytocola sp.]